jgi:hypothetical protein
MICRSRIRWACHLVVLAVLVVAAGGCRRQKSVPLAKELHKEQRGPSSGAFILATPRVEGPLKSLVLAFCFDGDRQYDPQIDRVRVARVHGPKASCEMRAMGDAWLWNEWTVGSVPPGFELLGCDPLTPGEYEVYVDGFIGDGVLRMEIELDGSVRPLPWDSVGTVPPPCPRVDRRTPNILPRQAQTGEGVLEKRAREMRERRADAGLPPLKLLEFPQEPPSQ